MSVWSAAIRRIRQCPCQGRSSRHGSLLSIVFVSLFNHCRAVFSFLSIANAINPKRRAWPALISIRATPAISTKLLAVKTPYLQELRRDTLQCSLSNQGGTKPFFWYGFYLSTCRCSSLVLLYDDSQKLLLYLCEGSTHEHSHISTVRISTRHNSVAEVAYLWH